MNKDEKTRELGMDELEMVTGGKNTLFSGSFHGNDMINEDSVLPFGKSTNNSNTSRSNKPIIIKS